MASSGLVRFTLSELATAYVFRLLLLCMQIAISIFTLTYIFLYITKEKTNAAVVLMVLSDMFPSRFIVPIHQNVRIVYH